MVGIAIPSPVQVTSADGLVWPGVVAAIALAVVLVAAAWVFIRTRPDREVKVHDITPLPKAA